MSKNGRQDRTFNWGQWREVEKLLGIKGGKKDNKKNEDKRAAQRKKFAKCKVCGNQMTYIPNSNILICENNVEKKKTRVLEDGTKQTYTISEPCGNINLVDKQYQEYMNYLFKS